MYALNNNVTYFDSFGVEHIPKEIKIFIDKFIVVTNIFRIQLHESVMWGYYCIGFLDFMLKYKTLIDFNNLFLPNTLRKWWYNFKVFYEKCSKMTECNSHETLNIYPNLNVIPLNAVL